MEPVVRAVRFAGKNRHGDFTHMIKQEKYKNTLFLITENMHDYLNANEPGGGTAAIRLHCHAHCEEGKKPLAAGIPTGWSCHKGFEGTDTQVKAAIDYAFERIHVLVETHGYEKILYSCDDSNAQLIGRGIFADTLCDEVVLYISHKIHAIPEVLKGRDKSDLPTRLKKLQKLRAFEEEWLGPFANLVFKNESMKHFFVQRKRRCA